MSEWGTLSEWWHWLVLLFVLAGSSPIWFFWPLYIAIRMFEGAKDLLEEAVEYCRGTHPRQREARLEAERRAKRA